MTAAHSCHEDVFFRAFEWAHNTHHPSPDFLTKFAQVFADLYQYKSHTEENMAEVWEGFQAGRIRISPWLGG